MNNDEKKIHLNLKPFIYIKNVFAQNNDSDTQKHIIEKNFRLSSYDKKTQKANNAEIYNNKQFP